MKKCMMLLVLALVAFMGCRSKERQPKALPKPLPAVPRVLPPQTAEPPLSLEVPPERKPVYPPPPLLQLATHTEVGPEAKIVLPKPLPLYPYAQEKEEVPAVPAQGPTVPDPTVVAGTDDPPEAPSDELTLPPAQEEDLFSSELVAVLAALLVGAAGFVFLFRKKP
jgi:hypothetical protein